MRKIVFIILILLWSSAALYVFSPDQEDGENKTRHAQRARIEKSYRPALLWQNKT